MAIADNVAKFSWIAGDLVGVLPDEGAQVYFKIPDQTQEQAEGEEQTDDRRLKATFDGGAWALKANSNYAAYYPFVKDFDIDRTKVPVNYEGQKQNGKTTAHLGAYDYMGARPATTNEKGGVSFDFDHVGALVILKISVPQVGTTLKEIRLSVADGTKLFITKGTYSLASVQNVGFPITAAEGGASSNMTIGIENCTTTQANEEVSVYFMCAPMDLSDKTVNVTVDCNNSEFYLKFAGQKFEAGKGYALATTSVMGNITNPAQTRKGDLAMADGSFIRYKNGLQLTGEQKSQVKGIVFWTTTETTSSGRTTPASLTDDGVMASAFPSYNHGLIVALTDVSNATKWQSTVTSIANWQASTLTSADSYKSIASDIQPRSGINYILGYQNTQILKAYNNSLSENESANKVIPVSLLESFSTNNSAPVNTTDWFIPSVKELHMLCYKDVDDVDSVDGTGYNETITIVNNSLTAIGQDKIELGFYWSSTVYVNTSEETTFNVNFSTANIAVGARGQNSFHVRTVCAY